MFDEAEVHRPASLRSGRWTFISEDDPPGAGVRVDAESATAFLERGEPKTHDLRLDLFLPLSGSTGSLRLICHGGSEDLASPIALVHVGEPPRISHVHGDILALGLRVPGPGIRGARP